MKRFLACLLGLVATASLVWVAVPVFIIRPFTEQTTAGLATSFALRSRSGWLTLVLLAAGGIIAILLWPRIFTWKGRAFAGLAVVALGGCAWLARQNHFEWMFHPIPRVAFAAADEADHVAAGDMVLSVPSGGEAHAYPVLALAYHHVVNDVVGKEPIVATY